MAYSVISFLLKISRLLIAAYVSVRFSGSSSVFEDPFNQIALTMNFTDGEHFDIFWHVARKISPWLGIRAKLELVSHPLLPVIFDPVTYIEALT